MTSPHRQAFFGSMCVAIFMLGAATKADDGFLLGWYASVTHQVGSSRPDHIVSDGMAYGVVYNEAGDLGLAERFLEEAATAGLKVILDVGRNQVRDGNIAEIQAYIDALKDHTSLSGWYIYDEPDEVGITPAEGVAAFEAIKQRSSLPIYGAIDANRIQAQREYAGSYDRLVTFEYVFDLGDKEFQGFEDRTAFGWITVEGWKTQTDAAATTARSLHKGWYHVIQAHGRGSSGLNQSVSLRLPTADELAFMTFYSVVKHNADGVFYFASHWVDHADAQPTQPFPGDGSAWRLDVLRPLVEEFKSHYLPAIRAGALPDAVEVMGDHGVHAKLYRNPDSDAYYLLVVNEGDPIASVVLDFGKTWFRTARSITDGAVKDLRDGYLELKLPRYGTARYRLSGVLKSDVRSVRPPLICRVVV